MSFLSVDEYVALPLGADLSSYVDPVSQELTGAGNVALQAILDKATAMLGDYVGTPLEFHVVRDETHPVFNQQLTTFPLHAPPRAAIMFALLMAAQSGVRQNWTMPLDPLETVYGPAIPMLSGNVQVDRTYNMFNVTSYAGALGFPWASLLGAASEIILTYTAGYDLADASAMVVFDTVVDGATTPTTMQFSVPFGIGPWMRVGAPIAVGDQPPTIVSAVSNSLITVSPPLGAPPAVGDEIDVFDGVSLPPPTWLKEMERDVARTIINQINRNEMGISGQGQVEVGNVKWRVLGVDIDLPQPVKDSLDRRFTAAQAELA